MPSPTLTCASPRRRHFLRERELNGLDYLEVGDREKERATGRPDRGTLYLYFLGRVPEGIGPRNLHITGGRRNGDLRAIDVLVEPSPDPRVDERLKVLLDRPGDPSTYTLRLEGIEEIDPRYDRLEFTFDAGSTSDLDCKTRKICPPPRHDEPLISYLAKDYASFRQLLLDRLALVLPAWTERHVPDVGITLVEALAYAGDLLSYQQDAVATEAYLETARRRTSLRRHARLVDYRMHEGVNARAWVVLTVEPGDLTLDPREIDLYLITGYEGLGDDGVPLEHEALPDGPAGLFEVFEPLRRRAKEPIRLYEAHNTIRFHTWGDRECCLPRGATAATLRDPGTLPRPPKPDEPEPPVDRDPTGPERYEPAKSARQEPPPAEPPHRLRLEVGDVLILEERLSPTTGEPEDADPSHRHAVRLTEVEYALDRLLEVPIVHVRWAAEDALPFPLCISTLGPPPACEMLEDVGVARGNVLLVDHGRRAREPLDEVPAGGVRAVCLGEGEPAFEEAEPGSFRPVLSHGPLVFRQPLPPRSTPAARLLAQDPKLARPALRLRGAGGARWSPQPDLLASRGGDRHYVVEVDDEGLAHLRFGDGEAGSRPEAGTLFRAAYRVGYGPDGNVGAERISHVVLRGGFVDGVRLTARNPLPAQGGTAPESAADVRQLAPHVFRTELERAVTAADYARLAERHAGVERAAATLRWSGCSYKVVVALDPVGRTEAPATLLHEVARDLRAYRRMGHDVLVAGAEYVPLDIALTVCVEPDRLRGPVEAALGERLGSGLRPDGSRGFFHPDELSFGQGVHLSRLVAAAQAVPGVASVLVTRFQRLFEAANGELESGLLRLGPLEVARLDNDPDAPENGRLVLTLGGGR